MRDRSWSSDSEASTASQSSVASDASFYSASSGQSERGAALGYTSPDDGSSHGYPRSDSESGLGVHTFAPVLGWPEPETGLLEPPRVPLLFSTDAIPGAATSGRGLQPPSPFASQLPSQTGSPVAQTGTRSAAAAHGLLGPDPAPSGSPAATPRTSASSPGAAGPGSAYEPPPDPQARRSADVDAQPAPRAPAAALPAPSEVFRPGRAGGMLPVWAVPQLHHGASLAPSIGPQARHAAAQDTPPGRPAPTTAAEDTTPDAPPPGRADGMLPQAIPPGAALVTATARALAAATGTDDLDDGSSDDEDAHSSASRPQDPSTAVCPPGRAGGMLVDGGVPGVATTGPVPSPAAVATAPGVEAAAAAYADAAADRAAVEHHVRAALTQDQDYQASARVAPILGDALSSSRCITKTRSRDDDADTRCNSAVVSAPMDMAQGLARPTVRLRPLSPPLELRVGGKRRRLNGEDEDDRKLAELLLAEEEASTHHQAPRLPATSARPASVLAVYAHNAQRFTCTLCVYSAASFAALTRHRDSRHRRVVFRDQFSAGCSCGTPFASRLAAARHSQTCASLTHPPPAATVPAAGELNPTADAVNTTAPAVTAALDPPHQDTPELAASPPLTGFPQAAAQDPEQDRGRWGPPLPRELVAGRVATRLSELPAPRWGPPLPRTIVASRIADRLLPPTVTRDDEAKEDEETKDDGGHDPRDEVQDDEWLLRFDGACRANPGPGGAGAALFKPSGHVVWTASHYMPSSSETNNTAEYTALLLGARAAADHGVTHLRVEGDSTLVIQQVRGIFATRSTRLRELRRLVKVELARMERVTLHHIDRQSNAHADRLANAALDRRRTKLECGVHVDGTGCTRTTMDTPTPAAPDTPVGRPSPPTATDTDVHDDDLADIDDGEVYAAMRVGPDAVPQRRPRLRLRQLPEEEEEVVGAMVERLGASLAAKITDASDWETAEGYITALPHLLYDKLRPYSQAQRHPKPRHQQQQQHDGHRQTQQRQVVLDQDEDEHVERDRNGPRRDQPDAARQHNRRRKRHGRSRAAKRQRRRRPPRVTRHHREHRLDEALDDLHTVERASPSDRTAIRRARRRVGRVNSAITQQLLRSRFDKEEKTCVEEILAAARAQRASAHTTASCNGTAPPPAATATDDGLCPIPSAELWRFFDGVNTPLQEFVPDAATGATFRSAMARLPTASRFRELLTEAPTLDDIETQLQHVRGASSPGLDGVGYDVYQKFAVQLLPALGAAFKRCWEAKKVPLSWKLGVVRLLYKKGERTDPANWRPICLQQAVYKLYSGVLARRLGRWLDANDRHAPGQKGFRAVNGCGEHNFLAATLVDQARRKRRTLFEVWYDFRNAFGSVPFALLWDSLARLGVPDDYVAMCKGLYESAAFVVGNAEDGTTDPVRLRVGVFQGCPLSPQLFNAAISPLLFALQRLPDTGVQLSTDDRLDASAYADDLKTFSSTEDGIKRQHALVVDFLRWTGMAANPSKCCTMSVQRDHRGVLKTCDLGLELDGDPIPALGMADSYSYLGIGDGFDHVRRRVELAPALKQLKDDATALLQSGLAPWQVVKATKTYLYPRVEYALRHLRPFQQQLEGFDRHLVRGLRHLLRLPVSATTEFLYAPVSRGGLGLLPLTELHAALQVAHGWQMLHSKDPAIRRIARVQLRQIADARHRVDTQAWADREDELCEKLLNSQLGASPDAPPKRRNGDIGSLWVDIQRHLRTLGLKLETAPACVETGAAAATLQLRVPHHEQWLDHGTVLRHVKLHIKHRHWTKWAAMKDQGKTARTHGGAGSGFLTRPRGLWESDYRFAVAGRLNQLDTHSVLKRRRLRAHDKCRHPGCARSETLAHVLNHCSGTMDAVRGRHDDVLKTIERSLIAASSDSKDRVELRTNQTVPSLAGPALRPDLQLYNHTKRTVAVVDLAVAFEEQASDDPDSSPLVRIAAHKREKYGRVKRHLERQGWRVHLSALVYGSLGAVAGGNHKVFTEHLGLLKRDAKRLDRAISVACIQSSRRIWNLHCSQHRARQQTRQGSRGRRVVETGGTPPRTDRR